MKTWQLARGRHKIGGAKEKIVEIRDVESKLGRVILVIDKNRVRMTTAIEMGKKVGAIIYGTAIFISDNKLWCYALICEDEGREAIAQKIQDRLRKEGLKGSWMTRRMVPVSDFFGSSLTPEQILLCILEELNGFQ